jgi:predicted thioredoxin/glutaredoxin
METLIKKVAAVSGITEAQAQAAIQTVGAALKEKLPIVMHVQIDTLLNDGTLTDAMKSQLHDLTDRTGAAFDEMKNRAGEIADEMKNKMNDFFKKSENTNK